MKERYLEQLNAPIDEGEDIPISFPTLMLLIVSGAYVLGTRDLFADWNERTVVGKVGASIMAVLWIALLPVALVAFALAAVLVVLELTPRVLADAYVDHAFAAQKTNKEEA